MLINPYIFGPPVELLPTQGTFTLAQTIDLFEVSPAALVDVTDDFTSDNWTRIVGSGSPTFAVASGVGTATLSAGSSFLILQTTLGGALPLPQFWAEVELTQVGTAASGDERIGVGFTKDANNRIMAEWSKGTSNLYVSCRHNGGATSVVSVATSVTLTAGYRLGVSMCGNGVTVWTCAPAGTWSVRGTRDVTSIRDFTVSANYASFVPTLSFTGAGASTWKVDNFKAGRFGSAGLKDPMIVYRRDGSALMDSGKMVFTTTALHPTVSGGMGGGYTGVYRMDLDTYAWEQIGVVFMGRSSGTWNDLNLTGIEKADGTYKLFTATWGGVSGSALGIQSTDGAASDFSGSKIINMSALTVPTISGAVGWYDPSVIWDGSRYLMGYAATNALNFSPEKIYPLLAESSDLTTWTAIGNDSAQSSYEGPFMYQAGGSWFVIVSRRGSPVVYDATMANLGNVSAPLASDGNTIPHAVIVPHNSKRVLLTFSVARTANGYAERRDLLVWEANRYA